MVASSVCRGLRPVAGGPRLRGLGHSRRVRCCVCPATAPSAVVPRFVSVYYRLSRPVNEVEVRQGVPEVRPARGGTLSPTWVPTPPAQPGRRNGQGVVIVSPTDTPAAGAVVDVPVAASSPSPDPRGTPRAGEERRTPGVSGAPEGVSGTPGGGCRRGSPSRTRESGHTLYILYMCVCAYISMSTLFQVPP